MLSLFVFASSSSSCPVVDITGQVLHRSLLSGFSLRGCVRVQDGDATREDCRIILKLTMGRDECGDDPRRAMPLPATSNTSKSKGAMIDKAQEETKRG